MQLGTGKVAIRACVPVPFQPVSSPTTTRAREAGSAGGLVKSRISARGTLIPAKIEQVSSGATERSVLQAPTGHATTGSPYSQPTT